MLVADGTPESRPLTHFDSDEEAEIDVIDIFSILPDGLAEELEKLEKKKSRCIQCRPSSVGLNFYFQTQFFSSDDSAALFWYQITCRISLEWAYGASSGRAPEKNRSNKLWRAKPAPSAHGFCRAEPVFANIRLRRRDATHRPFRSGEILCGSWTHAHCVRLSLLLHRIDILDALYAVRAKRFLIDQLLPFFHSFFLSAWQRSTLECWLGRNTLTIPAKSHKKIILRDLW